MPDLSVEALGKTLLACATSTALALCVIVELPDTLADY